MEDFSLISMLSITTANTTLMFIGDMKDKGRIHTA
jgi:hypothetical protein